MIKDVFMPTDILLPEGVSPEKWSVIACDQFSSERDYWERVRAFAGDEPSTLNLIVPEAYLEEFDEESGIDRICAYMNDYMERGVLREVKDSFVYVERSLPGGDIRRGLVGAIDLEQYDFSGGDYAILASEGTLLERLPIRIHVRRAALLELPHIMAFIDDKENTVIEPLSKKSETLDILYDFDLMEGGGHIRGMHVHGDNADSVMSAMRKLREKNRTLMVIGDGNHSLAAAKVYWDELKLTLSDAERKHHPARFALLEINNVYDYAIEFEAIHRIVFNANPADFISAFEKAMPKGSDYEFCWLSRDSSGVIGVAADCIGDALAVLQFFLDDYSTSHGCRLDYIHGTETVKQLAKAENSVGLILPAMDKSELFATVTAGGVFPKKSFSVGHAREKRYYLECRRVIKR